MHPSDDKVEEGHLSSAFDITCRAWQVRGQFFHLGGRVDVYNSDDLVSRTCGVVVHCRSAPVLPSPDHTDEWSRGTPSARNSPTFQNRSPPRRNPQLIHQTATIVSSQRILAITTRSTWRVSLTKRATTRLSLPLALEIASTHHTISHPTFPYSSDAPPVGSPTCGTHALLVWWSRLCGL